jgi:hypothetical protein
MTERPPPGGLFVALRIDSTGTGRWNGAFDQRDLLMARLWFVLTLVSVVINLSVAHATTYTYAGPSLTYTYSLPQAYINCAPCVGAGITGSINFNFDTSNFTGSYVLNSGDTAGFVVFAPAGGYGYSYPGGFTWFGPPGGFGTFTFINAAVTFENGQIVAWNVTGSDGEVNCGGGPGCTYGGSITVSSDSGDGAGGSTYPYDFTATSKSVIGTWTEVVDTIPAVPEPSTWAR